MNSLAYRSFAAHIVAVVVTTACCTTPPPEAESPDATPGAIAAPATETPQASTAEAPPAPPPTAEPSPASPPGARAPAAEGGMCGGIAGVACQSGLYCAFAPEARCGAADASGTCRARPEFCTEEYAPVCGCDDKTYGNACAAAREGISVARSGACPAHAPSAAPAATAPALAEGQLCGTRGVRGECGAGLYCAYRRDCGADDSGGTCAKKGSICTKIYAPVCGCDNKTYGNACTAAAAGVSVAKRGECPP